LESSETAHQAESQAELATEPQQPSPDEQQAESHHEGHEEASCESAASSSNGASPTLSVKSAPASVPAERRSFETQSDAGSDDTTQSAPGALLTQGVEAPALTAAHLAEFTLLTRTESHSHEHPSPIGLGPGSGDLFARDGPAPEPRNRNLHGLTVNVPPSHYEAMIDETYADLHELGWSDEQIRAVESAGLASESTASDPRTARLSTITEERSADLRSDHVPSPAGAGKAGRRGRRMDDAGDSPVVAESSAMAEARAAAEAAEAVAAVEAFVAAEAEAAAAAAATAAATAAGVASATGESSTAEEADHEGQDKKKKKKRKPRKRKKKTCKGNGKEKAKDSDPEDGPGGSSPPGPAPAVRPPVSPATPAAVSGPMLVEVVPMPPGTTEQQRVSFGYMLAADADFGVFYNDMARELAVYLELLHRGARGVSGAALLGRLGHVEEYVVSKVRAPQQGRW
jgi:hypothetical protein